MKKTFLFVVISTFMLLTSCDSGLYITQISISKYPDKIAYICTIDNELVLDGLEITVKTKEGSKSTKKWDDEYDRKLFDLIYDIDFSKVGIYIITIKCNDSFCTFPIEVIKSHNE